MSQIDFKNLSGMKGDITLTDIKEGFRGECETCPVARVLNRMFPGFLAYVEVCEVQITNQHGVSMCWMNVGLRLSIWIAAFDEGTAVEPLSIGIDKRQGEWTLEVLDDVEHQS